MSRTSRTVAAVVASLALAASTSLVVSGAVSAAEAAQPVATAKPTKPTKPGKPAKPGKPGKSPAALLLKDIAVKDQQLARLATSDTVTGLADASETAVVAGISAARTTLAELAATVTADGSSVDVRAVRRWLQAFRVENLAQAAGILRRVDELDAVATDPEAQALLTQARAGALAVAPTSPKSDVQAAKALVEAAEAALDAALESARSLPG